MTSIIVICFLKWDSYLTGIDWPPKVTYTNSDPFFYQPLSIIMSCECPQFAVGWMIDIYRMNCVHYIT